MTLTANVAMMTSAIAVADSDGSTTNGTTSITSTTNHSTTDGSTTNNSSTTNSSKNGSTIRSNNNVDMRFTTKLWNWRFWGFYYRLFFLAYCSNNPIILFQKIIIMYHANGLAFKTNGLSQYDTFTLWIKSKTNFNCKFFSTLSKLLYVEQQGWIP